MPSAALVVDAGVRIIDASPDIPGHSRQWLMDG